MRLKLVVLLGIAALLLGPAQAFAQKGGFGGGKGGFGGGAGGGDPSQYFQKMTGGKNVWVRSEISDPRQQKFFDMIAQSLNITNGQISLEQFQAGMEAMKSKF